MQEREYLGSREHPHYCTCVECQTKRTAPAPTKLTSSEKKRRRKARQKAAKSDSSAINLIEGDEYDPSDGDKPSSSLLDQANEIVKQTPNPGSKKKKKRRKRK
jgi:hypothetical protein